MLFQTSMMLIPLLKPGEDILKNAGYQTVSGPYFSPITMEVNGDQQLFG